MTDCWRVWLYIVRSITFNLDYEMDYFHFILNGEDLFFSKRTLLNNYPILTFFFLSQTDSEKIQTKQSPTIKWSLQSSKTVHVLTKFTSSPTNFEPSAMIMKSKLDRKEVLKHMYTTKPTRQKPKLKFRKQKLWTHRKFWCQHGQEKLQLPSFQRTSCSCR